MAVISGLDARGIARARFDAGEAWLLGGATLLMLWPAFYNGYPLIFSDTGTYISQAMEFHLGWDRPPFYSFLILSLDWGRSLWPPVIAQCLVTAWLIRRCQRMIEPNAGLFAGAALLAPLALATSLPWIAAQIMPDIFTPIMVIAFAILCLDRRCARAERLVLMTAIGTAIMVHLTNLPIFAGLCLLALVAARWRGGLVPWRALLLPSGLGFAALIGVNVIAAGKISPSPYGATFMLARLIGDGPARVTLARDCRVAHWALCRYQAQMPHTADDFLWTASSPLYRAGGPMRLIGQTKAIVRRTIDTEPGTVLRDAARDFARQLITFAPGSGLRRWHATAGVTIRRDLAPGAVAAFTAGQQARGRLKVAPMLAVIVRIATIAGLAGTALFVFAAFGTARRDRLIDDRLFGFCVIVLVALLGNGAITGALSGPHDRYQSRVVWLAVMSLLLVIQRLYSAWRSRPTNRTA